MPPTAGPERQAALERFREAFARREFSGAMEICQRLLRHDGRDAAALRSLGLIYIELEREDEAREVLQRALAIDPRDATAYYAFGVFHSRKGEHAAAVQYFQRALAQSPTVAEVHLGLAAAYFHLGDFASAVYSYSQAYQLTPDNPDIPRGFGVALARLGSLKKAEFYLRTALDLRPGWPAALLDLGDVLLAQGRDREAAEALLAGLRATPRPEGLVSLARIHVKAREHREALAHLSQAMRSWPDHAPTWHVAGRCHAALGEWPAAADVLKTANRLAPVDAVVALDLAEALAESGGDPDRALSLAAAARANAPNDPRAAEVLGWCLFKHGRAEEARTELERARVVLELQDETDPVLARVATRLGAVTKALRAAERDG